MTSKTHIATKEPSGHSWGVIAVDFGKFLLLWAAAALILVQWLKKPQTSAHDLPGVIEMLMSVSAWALFLYPVTITFLVLFFCASAFASHVLGKPLKYYWAFLASLVATPAAYLGAFSLFSPSNYP